MQAVKALLDKHPNVHKVHDKPITYIWFEKDDRMQPEGKRDKDENDGGKKRCSKHPEQLCYACDACDACDTQKRKPEMENLSSGIPETRAETFGSEEKVLSHASHMQHTSHDDSTSTIDDKK